MKKAGLFTVLVCVSVVASGVAQQQLADADIDAAIKCGLEQTKCERPVLILGGFALAISGVVVEVIPPAGRVYLAARDAKAKYLSFSRAQVTGDMIEPTIEVRARDESKDMKLIVSIAHIVILPRGKKEGAVQPVKEEEWSAEAKNLAGASIIREGRAAYFKVADLPPGELDVAAITDKQIEFRGSIKAKDRVKLDAWSGVGARAAAK